MKEKRCECGNDNFYAHQVCRHTIYVDPQGNYQEGLDIYDSESPYGPFECSNCGKRYENIPDELPEVEVEPCHLCGTVNLMEESFIVDGKYVGPCCCTSAVQPKNDNKEARSE